MLIHPWDAAIDEAEWRDWLAATRLLPGIRAVRLAILRVEAKFTYDDHKPAEHREHVAESLEDRGRGLDAAAAAQRRRRLAARGEWRDRSGAR